MQLFAIPRRARLALALAACACGPSDQTYTITRDSTVTTSVEVLPRDSGYPLDDSPLPAQTDSQPPPQPEPDDKPPSKSCNPNYDPCVPDDSDVDCAGGKGNGPSYVQGPVRVIGRDVYKLDDDHDGIGCDRG